MVVVRNDMFYAEHEGTLFMWRLGDPEWTNTGLTAKDGDFTVELKLAVSEETVYVGKRDSKLFQSLDGGNSWRDVTPNLPLNFTRFNDIIFVGSTLYVATDNGVMVSQTEERWRVLTDNAGERPIMNRFAVDGSKVYGIGDAGGYRLDTLMKWEQIFSEVPSEIKTLAITNDKLYSATDYVKSLKEKGLFYISLEENEEK